VDSTNDVAFELAARGRPEGTVVIADFQKAGRGRRGRTWFSPRGRNLYLSILLRPEKGMRELPELSWVVAGAVALVLRETGVSNPIALKCPNDVLVGGRKIAGVLLENRIGPGQPGLVVAGIGLNVELTPEELPGDLSGRVTSLAMEGCVKRDPGELRRGICRFLEAVYGEWMSEGAGAVRRRLVLEGVGLQGFAPRGDCGEVKGNKAPGTENDHE
jgi:BirA family biotin operon repressor/biotin-[acetyl-CoA-carboxylase] ligase